MSSVDVWSRSALSKVAGDGAINMIDLTPNPKTARKRYGARPRSPRLRQLMPYSRYNGVSVHRKSHLYRLLALRQINAPSGTNL
jgi:hypothetical protein